MPTVKNNNIFEKTSFLGGNSSEFIEELYSQYVQNPKSISKEWKEFWDILFDDPNNEPEPCKIKCGVKEGEKLRNWSSIVEYHYDKPGQPIRKKDNNKGYVGS